MGRGVTWRDLCLSQAVLAAAGGEGKAGGKARFFLQKPVRRDNLQCKASHPEAVCTPSLGPALTASSAVRGAGWRRHPPLSDGRLVTRVKQLG